MQNQFQNDLEIEHLIRYAYTLPYFWNIMFKKGSVIPAESMEEQLKGIDLYVDGISVDEKCSTQTFVNMKKKPPTWAVEILSGWDSDGWFIDRTKVTQNYMFIQLYEWAGPMENVNGYMKPVQNIDPSRFVVYTDKLLFMYENRWKLMDIIQYVTSENMQSLREKALSLRNDGDKLELGNSGMRLVRTEVNGQHPVNLVIPVKYHEDASEAPDYLIDIKESMLCRIQKNLHAL